MGVVRKRGEPGEPVFVARSHDARLDRHSTVFRDDRDAEVRETLADVHAVDELAAGQAYGEGEVARRQLGVAVGRHACDAAGRVTGVCARSRERDLPFALQLWPLDAEPEGDPTRVRPPGEDDEAADVLLCKAAGGDANAQRTGNRRSRGRRDGPG